MGNSCSSKNKDEITSTNCQRGDARKEDNEHFFFPKTDISEMQIAEPHGNNPNSALDLIGPNSAFIELTDGYENDEGK